MRAVLQLLLAAATALLSACVAPGPWNTPPVPAAAGMGPVCGPQQYPFTALQDFQRGQVVVAAQVGDEGRLLQPVIEQATYNPYLNTGALAAVAQCRLPQARPGSQVRLLVVFEFYGQNEYLPNGAVLVFFAPPLPAG